MSTLEMFRSDQDSRRQWRRVPVAFTMRCKRLGRAEQEMVVRAVDLSPGGVWLHAPDPLLTGDSVLCWIEDEGGSVAGIKGLVVQGTAHRDRGHDAHVAWTNLSPESGEELARLLTLYDSETLAADTDRL